MSAAATAGIKFVRGAGDARALLNPERRRLVEALASGPDSASGLARRLGETRQRLNYHLRLLEDAGIVELAEERHKGSQPERVLRLVARQYVLDPATTDAAPGPPEDLGDRFSASYLVALASRTLRELADLLDRAKQRRARVATASINTLVRLPDPAAFQAFAADLTHAVGQVVARHHRTQGEGRWFRLVAGAYPGSRPSRASTETPHD
jgi:DNA-binding transcriptional ArsR family regulator